MNEIGERPWGKYYVLFDEPNFKLKRIEVLPGQRLSYQYHHHRQEACPLTAKHRVENVGEDTLIFIEVQTGTYFGEDDIVRIEDDYSRS